MSEISAQKVKALRDRTNAGMMECRKALMESGGDEETAVRWLRERGLAIAAKKADRAASDGQIKASVSSDGSSVAMIEVNCETDFVAKNENFQAFVDTLLKQAHGLGDGELAEAVKEVVASKIAEIGENIIVARNVRFQLQGKGILSSYIHLGGKVGVIAEFGAEKAETASNPAVVAMARELCMHVAASNPASLDRPGVNAQLVEAERALFLKQVEDKPEAIREKIVAGKLEKFYSQIVLLEQAFVIDPDVSVKQVLERVGKAAGDTLTLRRFVCFKLGVAG